MNFLLTHLLSNSAARSPQNTAVVFGDDSITYAELEDVTSRLAARLSERGVSRGDRVGICMNKSIGSIIGLLGILKAGAAYVPLDPNAPPSRIAYIVENCGIRVLMTSRAKIQKLVGAFAGATLPSCVVVMDGPASIDSLTGLPVLAWNEIKDTDPSRTPDHRSIDTDLAYVLYTSGSTGAPKGVMISHLNSLTFVNWSAEAIGATDSDRLSNHAPLHFDLSIFDVFVSLKSGATLVLVPDGLSSFPHRLAEWIEHNRITIWYSVPSVLTSLVLHGTLERFRYTALKKVIFAGEVFPVKYLRRLMESIPHADYFNFYGPTETNVITYYQVHALPAEGNTSIPIGIPCANSEVFAVDENGGLVRGPGEIGELYARGSCVAQGYWGDPVKTRTGFVPHPLHPDLRETVYRTGDLVTLDEAGNYLFLGRRDHMIKRYGYRIELGEIEHALYQHPDVEEAAVIAIPDELTGNRIQAFVALGKDASSSTETLLDFCADRLPKYMVPERIHFRTRLPKTSTGKIDKSSLTGEALSEGGSS